ncbi:sporulation inhibitor of replication protein SirA [Paraliobacillus ryukyuensis]|uniref:sporulation inhibitor of replication protein SirA n=1 Tax=Paraliobacillus ryukyuensis TaxID=200904 RepID=UPI0009A5AB62|nr:sporulation inhibitor of replication protein SirA [Paraliobacillus ryukyuensis]
METYYMFFLEDEVQNNYFYKSGLLCQFIRSYLSNPDREDLRDQFFYITRVINQKDLMTCFKNDLPTYNFNLIEPYSITMRPRWVEVEFDSLQSAYSLFFQWIKQIRKCCFIVEKNGDNFGWLSPLRKESLLS